MKILHVITGLKFGGAEAALYNFLATAVPQRRAQHMVAYFHYGNNVEKIQRLGVTACNLSGLLLRYDISSLYKLKRLVTTFRPDIMHTSLWSANMIGRLLTLWEGVPLICDLHGNSFDEGWLRNWLDRLTVKVPQRFVAVGDKVAQSYRENIIDQALSKTAIKPGKFAALQQELYQKLVVIKNGIDVSLVSNKMSVSTLTRDAVGIDKEAFVVGAVGRLEAIKSYDVLVKAFAHFLNHKKEAKPAFLCLVGDGSQRSNLETLVSSLNIANHVKFFGFQDDSYSWYRLFDCFALSSQSEGISIALLEAMVAGLPVITTNQDTQHEVITHGVHGLLVPVNDSKAYAQALESLYHDPDLVHSMRRANSDLIANSFDIKRVVDSYYKLYDETIASSR